MKFDGLTGDKINPSQELRAFFDVRSTEQFSVRPRTVSS